MWLCFGHPIHPTHPTHQPQVSTTEEGEGSHPRLMLGGRDPLLPLKLHLQLAVRPTCHWHSVALLHEAASASRTFSLLPVAVCHHFLRAKGITAGLLPTCVGAHWKALRRSKLDAIWAEHSEVPWDIKWGRNQRYTGSLIYCACSRNHTFSLHIFMGYLWQKNQETHCWPSGSIELL